MLFFGVFLRESARAAAKRRTNLITNSGKAANRSSIYVQIHLGMDIRHKNCPSRHKGGTGGLGGQKVYSGEAVKRLDRLATTLVHVCGFIWEWA